MYVKLWDATCSRVAQIGADHYLKYSNFSIILNTLKVLIFMDTKFWKFSKWSKSWFLFSLLAKFVIKIVICKFGSKTQNLILLKSKLFTSWENLYLQNEILLKYFETLATNIPDKLGLWKGIHQLEKSYHFYNFQRFNFIVGIYSIEASVNRHSPLCMFFRMLSFIWKLS